MNIVSHEFVVKTTIQLSKEELDRCLQASSRHYDAYCRSMSQIGGFLFGMNNLMKVSDNGVIEDDLTGPELDLLIKILQENEYFNLREKVVAIFHENQKQYKIANGLMNKDIFDELDVLKSQGIEFWKLYRKNGWDGYTVETIINNAKYTHRKDIAERVVSLKDDRSFNDYMKNIIQWAVNWNKFVIKVDSTIQNGDFTNLSNMADLIRPAIKAAVELMDELNLFSENEFSGFQENKSQLEASQKYIEDLPTQYGFHIMQACEEIARGESEPVRNKMKEK